MFSPPERWAPRPMRSLVVLLLFLCFVPAHARAQYFGRNKVQYEQFGWKIIKSDHFDNFFYPSESLIVHDAARMAERWYTRHSETFRHAFDRKSLIFYADHPDFEQTNVVSEQLEEGTGGVTEGMRTRVIMPFTGIYQDNDHVLGHELVHVFQYNIAEAAPGGGLARLNTLPLWLIEGMAEYLSLGRNDPLTAMWMRDAVMRDKFPTIKQLTTDPRFFPYRYGQALWAYVGGKWGDRAVIDIYRRALTSGWDPALVRVLGINNDSLSKEWAASNRAFYRAQIATRTNPDSVGRIVIPLGRKMSEQQNVSPVVSPDGNTIAFVSSRGLFTTDVYLADTHTGRIIRRLAGPQSDPHFDNISFINSSGGWSPDGRQFAFIVYADGNNEIAVIDTRSSSLEKRIKLPGIGAISHVSWSPDGRTLALAGQKGGVSDLFLLDIATSTVRQLTNDRNADIQPAWSPDGKMLAFATDRGAATDFNLLKFSPLEIATIDVATGQIQVYAPLPTAAHNINPQWTPDGKDLYFVSDPDGIPDIFRISLATGETRRVTHVATGISGITSISPAITVSQQTGELMFTVFQSQGFSIHALDPAHSVGVPLSADTTAIAQAGGAAMPGSMLPPPGGTTSTISQYLAAPAEGLVSGNDFEVVPYHPSFSLDALGQPQIGVAAGGPFGTGVAGGVSAFFGDQLSDQQIATAIQANGTVRDIGGALYYTNLKRRINWGGGIEHVPYLTGYVFLQPVNGGTNINQVLQRIYVDQASVFSQYPFDQTRRVELNVTTTRLGFEQELDQITVDAFGNAISEQRLNLPAPPPIYYAEPEVAVVGDNSYSAFTSPVAGMRYRLSYSPTIGNISFQTVLADYRKYFFLRPVTFALRGIHYGRYGKDAESGRLSPLYLGEETLIRGYGLGSLSAQECVGATTPQSCPVFDRMFGSRMDVFNAELRLPVFGTREFGLFNFPYLPTELAPFFDAGVAYTSTQHPDFRFVTNESNASRATCTGPTQTTTDPNVIPIQCADRIPVFSTGVSARINFLGYLILEAYAAYPFQRPNRSKNVVFGFQLAPGW